MQKYCELVCLLMLQLIMFPFEFNPIRTKHIKWYGIKTGMCINLVLSSELLQVSLLATELSLSALAALLGAAQLQALLRVAL